MKALIALLFALSSFAPAQDTALADKISKIEFSRSRLEDVVSLFGEPKGFKSADGKAVDRTKLPRRFAVTYDGLLFALADDVVREMEITTPDYRYEGGIHVGSTMAEVFAQIGKPQATTSTPSQDGLRPGVLYERTGGEPSVLVRRDLGMTYFFKEGKLVSIALFPQRGGKMKEMPRFDPAKAGDPFQLDLRGADLSGLDLRTRKQDLLQAVFDTRTIWPGATKMPADFNARQVIELGKNPGLGVRSLHKQGITGRGVSIAIVDNPLLEDHKEYAGRVRVHEYINASKDDGPHFHGSSVASLALGSSLGIAPEADLYYFSCWPFSNRRRDLRPRAKAFERILEINQTLPPERKIRVIATAIGWRPDDLGAAEMEAAVQKAKEAGILVVSSSMERTHGFKFHGLGREPLADPEQFESYGPGQFWAADLDRGAPPADRLLVPMDSRTTAGSDGPEEYIFARAGGWSWAIPYIAGTYALAAQVDPSITPDRFWALAMQTGRKIALKKGNPTVMFGPIIDPVALIAALKPSSK